MDDAHLERAFGVHVGRRHLLDDGAEQGLHVALAYAVVQPRVTTQRRSVHHRKVQLLVAGAEPVKQLEGLVQHPGRPCAVAVNLVDHHDRSEAHFEGLLGDEAGLRHGPVNRVHQQ